MSTADQASPWEREFVGHLPLIERAIAFVARRHHLSDTESEDFASHVKLKIIEDDYLVLRSYEGRSSLHTYLVVVIGRLCQDYRNHLWGKWRPSAVVRRQGRVAVLLEQLLVRDGHTFEEAYEILTTNHGIALSRPEAENLAERLPIRTKRRLEPETALADVPAPAPQPDALVEERDRRSSAGRVWDILAAVASDLDPLDRCILAMRFEDGRSVAEIAASLKLDQKRLYRRVSRVLAGLRAGLEAQGIGASVALQIFEGPMDEAPAAGAESVFARPSDEKGARGWT